MGMPDGAATVRAASSIRLSPPAIVGFGSGMWHKNPPMLPTGYTAIWEPSASERPLRPAPAIRLSSDAAGILGAYDGWLMGAIATIRPTGGMLPPAVTVTSRRAGASPPTLGIGTDRNMPPALPAVAVTRVVPVCP